MSHGAINCPFFTLTILPVLAAATSKSVWRERKAGICNTSATSATGAHCHDSCTSVKMGKPKVDFTSCKICNPASIPTPRCDMLVRLALSYEDLKYNVIPNRSHTCFSVSAVCITISRLSIAQGPAMRNII